VLVDAIIKGFVMHILHILPHLANGGAERQMFYLTQELIHLGHKVDIAYLYEGKKDLYPKFVENANYYQIKCKGNYDPLILLQLIRLIKSRKPDIVQTWIRQMDILGGLAAIFTQTNWLIREPSSSKAYPPNWKHLLRIRMAKLSRMIVANSKEGLNYWKPFYPHKKMRFVPNGVPLQSIEGFSINANNTHVFQIKNFVLYAGRIEKLKNIDVLIRAIYKLNQKQELNLIICGDGSQKQLLEKLIYDLNLNNNVFMTGAVSPENVWFFMKRAKAFVLLSAYEGCPNVLLEAMVCQCPLIVSDIPAHRAFLNENNSLWVNQITPEFVADKILDLVTKQNDANNRAKIARQLVEKWSLQKMARKYEQLYQWIIQNN
jgi:glycosyltransferase involved in cell wall biosynthesis